MLDKSKVLILEKNFQTIEYREKEEKKTPLWRFIAGQLISRGQQEVRYIRKNQLLSENCISEIWIVISGFEPKNFFPFFRLTFFLRTHKSQ